MAKGTSFSVILAIFVRVPRTATAVRIAKTMPQIYVGTLKLSSEAAAELTCVMLPMTNEAAIQTAEKMPDTRFEPNAESI